MRIPLVLLSLGLCLPHMGCSMCDALVRNITLQPATEFDRKMELKRNDVLAEAAWAQVVEAAPEHTYSADYRAGFVKGFADYLFLGGKGEPPPVAPFHYWTLHEQTPLGLEAAQDWFAGFRHGSAAARASGLRELATISLSRQYGPDPYRRPATYGSGQAGSRSETVPTLPMPRPVSPTADDPSSSAATESVEPFAVTHAPTPAPARRP